MNCYDDIINLPHPTSKKHPRMAVSDRAAQFSPFAALTGYDAAVKETARLTDRRIELDEYERAELDRKFQMIREHLTEEMEIAFTYFEPDEQKEGGAYLTVAGCVKNIEEDKQVLVLKDGSRIPFHEVIALETEI